MRAGCHVDHVRFGTDEHGRRERFACGWVFWVAAAQQQPKVWLGANAVDPVVGVVACGGCHRLWLVEDVPSLRE